jgi:hypothetical protein
MPSSKTGAYTAGLIHHLLGPNHQASVRTAYADTPSIIDASGRQRPDRVLLLATSWFIQQRGRDRES